MITSFDGVAIGTEGDAAAPEAGRTDAETSGRADASPPAVDAGSGEAATPDAAICFAGGTYCGGDKNGEPAGNLYRCTPDGRGFTLALTCAHGCIYRNGTDDVCECHLTGYYCGGDQVLGDSGTLYTCGPNYTPVVKTVCPNGCKMNIGTDDACL